MQNLSRRDFTRLTLAALPAAALLSSVRSAHAADPAAKSARPNSRVNGVHIGLNVPYSFGNNAMDADTVLQNCVSLGVSALELRAQPVEGFLGVPAELVSMRRTATGGDSARSKNGPADPAAAKASAARLDEWRRSVPMSRVAEFRKKYEDAGVFIEILKVDGVFKMSEPSLDYHFAMAKALGARAVSTEISHDEADLKRIGAIADKHQFPIGYHGHMETGPEDWEHAFALAKYNWANVDIGHFVAGHNKSPVEFIKKQHERITHVHIKDRKMNRGANVPFGQGDTPIVEVLRLIRDQRWPIQATIEFEYPVPAGSTRMAEIAKAVQFCREALA